MVETLIPAPVAAGAGGPASHGSTRTRRDVLAYSTRLIRSVAVGTVGLLLLIAVWEFLPRLGVVDKTFVPPFSEVISAWWHLLKDGTLWEDTEASLIRAMGGFAIAVAIGVPLGLLIGWYRIVADVLNPVLELFRNTAALSLLPVFILIMGIGESSKVAFVAYACIWPILLNTISGVESVDPLLVKSARSLGLGSFRTFQKVILPASVPTIFTGIRLAGSFSLLVLIAAELVGANSGLGFLITYSQQNFAIPNMYAAIITISMIGVVLNQLLLLLERHFSTWRAAGLGN
ncbi:MAG TPA: ABC transporter permease [Solirubrobacterales bacterium]|nr:ABC transporter permease [Solirubrobacterales bacterium]